jgi:hypothetical protein
MKPQTAFNLCFAAACVVGLCAFRANFTSRAAFDEQGRPIHNAPMTLGTGRH